MVTVSDYGVIRAFRPDKLAEKVKKALAEGWQLHGSMQLTSYWDHGSNSAVEVYAQPMVKQ